MIAGASLAREHRLVLEDRVELPRIYIAWLSPAMFAADDAELDLVADLLANGKTSRLYRTLVYERRIALDVSAHQHSRELGSFFLLAATAAPGQSLAEIHGEIDAELERVSAMGPTDSEMERALAQAEAQFMYRLQTVGGFGGKSDQLNAYNVLCGNPGFFTADLDRYRRATHESVRVASAPVPASRCARRAERDSSWPAGAGAGRLRSRVRIVTVDRSDPGFPDVGPDPAFSFPEIARHTPAQRARGADRRARERPGHHDACCRWKAAPAPMPSDKEGLAAIVADMVDEGTGALSAIDVSDALARIGADYDVDVSPDVTSFSLTTLARFAARGASLLADMTTKPSLRETDFTRVRQMRLDRLKQLKDLPARGRRARIPAAGVRAASVRAPADRQRRRTATPLTGRCVRLARGDVPSLTRDAGHDRRALARRR